MSQHDDTEHGAPLFSAPTRSAADDNGRGPGTFSASGPRTGADPRAGGPPRQAAKPKAHLPLPLEMGLLLALALALAVVIKAFFVQAFYIPSGSMNDTLVLNDRILVEKVGYWWGQPQRGDVVVFQDPGGWLDRSQEAAPGGPLPQALELFGLYPTGGHLVKRVIGVGGDHVVCCDEDGRITVNGVALHERSYLAPGERPSLIRFDKTVPEGYLWVMGDNRSQSADSRVHMGGPGGGYVPVGDVVGKVFAVVWPLDHTTFLHRPEAFDGVARSAP